jgi:endonuclease/exonuclease/phosphatase family metal-dependent hydrolase
MITKLASYNIQYGKGKDEQFDLDRIIAELGAPDLIALQEVERNNAQRGMVDQVAEIAGRLDHMHWVYGPGIDVDASAPKAAKPAHCRRQFGNMVLSRWPILSVINHTLPKVALAQIFHLQRTLVETVIDHPDGKLRFCSVHLDHVSTDTRMAQVDYMVNLMTNGQHRGASWGGQLKTNDWMERPEPQQPARAVIMGDMNFTPNGAEYTRVVGDMSNLHGRTTKAGGLADAWLLAGHDEAQGDTLPRDGKPAMRIDHCFVTADLLDSVRTMTIGNDSQGSDHQPIFVEIDLADSAKAI